jgi:anti-sigma-K factor RskA
MTVHEQYADDLALYALGSLEPAERVPLEKHLDECAACRRELEQLHGDMALLALSATGPMPPQHARQRLMDAIKREPRRQVAPKGTVWWAIAGWAAAAAMGLAVVLLLKDKSTLVQEALQLRSLSNQQAQELQEARNIVETLRSPGAQVVNVTKTNARPQPQGKAFYVRDRSSLIFLASNMPALPPQKAYELWLIPMQGAAIPAGMFKPNARGNAMVINPPLPAGVQAKAFAVTVEPESGSSVPTMPIEMMGAGE